MGNLIELRVAGKNKQERRLRDYRQEWFAVLSIDGRPWKIGPFDTADKAWNALADEEWEFDGPCRYGDVWLGDSRSSI
jgi:hypothetical protein